MISLRPIEAADAPALARFYGEGLGIAARYNRFLGAISEASPALLAQMTRADPARSFALVATRGEDIIGEARYAINERGHAEFAVAVADAVVRRGIGSRLMRALAARARRAGFARMVGEVLATNAGMLEFVRKAGFRLRGCPGEARLVCATLDLEPRETVRSWGFAPERSLA